MAEGLGSNLALFGVSGSRAGSLGISAMKRCVYCGQLATVRDRRCLPGRTVPACSECYALAQRRFTFVPALRAAYVKFRLELRYTRILNIPVWDESELSELSGKLRETVEAALAERVTIVERLAWATEGCLGGSEGAGGIISFKS
jgi:hypothetical protein